MKVVSNASPLVNLARIGQLRLLPLVFGHIVLPDAVWQEVVDDGRGQPGAEEIRRASWINRASVSNQPLVHSLRQDLDAGEAEAIVLAVEINADWLLMDERLGRETARHFGLTHVGLVGILGEAKQRGIVRELRPLLNQLRDVAGFRMSSELYNQVLRDAGEQE
jgi:predicted nucleic acid-binding protein